MENTVSSRLHSVQLGEAQFYRNIAILPLLAPAEGTCQYRTLGEALAASDVTITEVSVAGAVPELLVVNRGRMPVLLIDGEELAGAKQNRVLNTSILLKEGSETRIPVSCTEQGRWAYTSPAFGESGEVMAYKSRSRKTRSVQSSLESLGHYQSDQNGVWNDIAELQLKSGTKSPTAAMGDVYKARQEDLRACDETFKPVANQAGLLVFIGGAPVGVDLVSLSSAYAHLHPKLVRSYALEALLDSSNETVKPEAVTSRAREFLTELALAEESQFPSIGHGTDHRYKGKALTGTALVHGSEVIHAAFLRLDGPERPEEMTSYTRRRRPLT